MAIAHTDLSAAFLILYIMQGMANLVPGPNDAFNFVHHSGVNQENCAKDKKTSAPIPLIKIYRMTPLTAISVSMDITFKTRIEQRN